MGMILLIKAGYNIMVLGKLLAIKLMCYGYKVLTYGGKTTVIYSMNIFVDIWGNKGDKYGKYSSKYGVQRC